MSRVHLEKPKPITSYSIKESNRKRLVKNDMEELGGTNWKIQVTDQDECKARNMTRWS